jgi:hypothetical protein
MLHIDRRRPSELKIHPVDLDLAVDGIADAGFDPAFGAFRLDQQYGARQEEDWHEQNDGQGN